MVNINHIYTSSFSAVERLSVLQSSLVLHSVARQGIKSQNNFITLNALLQGKSQDNK